MEVVSYLISVYGSCYLLSYYSLAYLLNTNSMEVFTYLSNHSGKLVSIAWKLSLSIVTNVAYLLDSMEVFTYLSNHSGKLVLIAWKLSSFSFVRSKLNLQPLGIIITIKRL